MRRRRRRPIPQVQDPGGGGGGGGGGSPTIVISPTVQATSALRVGWVHTQHEGGTLVAGLQTALSNASPVQAQHLQGFGAGAIWPTQAGAKDWSDMDRIFGTPGNLASGYMKDAGTARVLYAINCPKWMHTPTSGSWNDPVPQGSTTTEFDYKPPHHTQYDNFAQLIVDTLVRYTQITHVVVWNEFKGFWSSTIAADYGGGSGRWWYDDNGPSTYLGGYTAFYNTIYNAVKASSRSAVKVGGPYMVANTQGWQYSNDWADDTETLTINRLQGHAPKMWGYFDKKVLYSVRYWIEHAAGADFFALDLRNSTKDYASYSGEGGQYGGTVIAANPASLGRWDANPQSGSKPYFWNSDDFSAMQKIPDIINYLRGLATVDATKYGASNAVNMATIPIWWMEWYPNALVNEQVNNPNTGTPYADTVSNDARKVAVAAEGLKMHALAGTEGLLHWRPLGDSNGHANPIGLTNTSGTATGLVAVCQDFKDNFSAGAQFLTPTNVPTGVSVLATATKALLINQTNASITFNLDGTAQTLAAFEVKLVTRP